VIVVRQETGKVAVYDAYCPHLGADLSVGGEIVANNERSACIKCPFHGWLYRCSDGTCVQVPYAKDQSELKHGRK
jgi:cholesterol 7-dehydrogenase